MSGPSAEGQREERPLIGITGHMGAGKDSAARILCEKYDYMRFAFADALKLEVWSKSVRNLNYMQGTGHTLSFPAWLAYCEEHKHDPPESASGWPRQLLQSWAEMRRDLCGDDYWLRQVVLQPGIVVSDVRYANEADAITAAGGILWRIERPGYGGDAHASEVNVDALAVARIIHNTGTLDDLRVKVRLALADARWACAAAPRVGKSEAP